MEETEKKVVRKLDKLAEIRATEAAIREEYETKKAKVLGDLKPKLDGLEVQYGKIFLKARQAVDDLEAEVKALVLAFARSVKGENLQAVYMNGRVTWDSKGLDGYAVANPEVLAFRKQGDSSVSIREIGEKTA